MTHDIAIKSFDELTSVDIYYILKARSQVFVVEQNCVYQDIDTLDFDCLHLVVHQDERLIGYCRIIPPHFNTLDPAVKSAAVLSSPSRDGSDLYPMPAIGRVLVMPEYRGEGLARQIMTQAIKTCHKKYGKKPIIISAQTYLQRFYESLGFEAVSAPYLEDGIDHIIMILKRNKKMKMRSPHSANIGAMVNKTLMTLLLLILALMVIGVIYLGV